jgi:hypothetical protein
VLELTQEELTSLKDDAHKLFISKASIDTFVQDATSEQVSAVRRLIHIETAGYYDAKRTPFRGIGTVFRRCRYVIPNIGM